MQRVTPRRASTSRLRRDERGTAIVEFALVVPVLVLIIFGILDFGNVYNQYESLRHGVQEAARVLAVPSQSTSSCTYGTTNNSGGSYCDPWPYNKQADSKCGTQAGASNDLVGVSPGTSNDVEDFMCTVKADIGFGSGPRVDIVFASAPGGSVTPTTWKGPSSTGGGAVVVCAASPVSSITGFFASLFGGSYMKSETEYEIELPLPSGTSEEAGSETDPTGASWSWCKP